MDSIFRAPKLQASLMRASLMRNGRKTREKLISKNNRNIRKTFAKELQNKNLFWKTALLVDVLMLLSQRVSLMSGETKN